MQNTIQRYAVVLSANCFIHVLWKHACFPITLKCNRHFHWVKFFCCELCSQGLKRFKFWIPSCNFQVIGISLKSLRILLFLLYVKGKCFVLLPYLRIIWLFCFCVILQCFAAVIMRIREPKTTALIFASGKMVSCSTAQGKNVWVSSYLQH